MKGRKETDWLSTGVRPEASAFPVVADEDEVEGEEVKDEVVDEEGGTRFPAKNESNSLSPGFFFSRFRNECIAAGKSRSGEAV